jgi:hypothetical protein
MASGSLDQKAFTMTALLRNGISLFRPQKLAIEAALSAAGLL